MCGTRKWRRGRGGQRRAVSGDRGSGDAGAAGAGVLGTARRLQGLGLCRAPAVGFGEGVRWGGGVPPAQGLRGFGVPEGAGCRGLCVLCFCLAPARAGWCGEGV